jgi:hypothetical protein
MDDLPICADDYTNINLFFEYIRVGIYTKQSRSGIIEFSDTIGAKNCLADRNIAGRITQGKTWSIPTQKRLFEKNGIKVGIWHHRYQGKNVSAILRKWRQARRFDYWITGIRIP